MSLIRFFNGSISIWKTFSLWYKSSLKFPILIWFLISLLEEHIILTSTLISWSPLILLNFWSVKTLKILDCVSSGISDTSSISNIPPEAFSKAPYDNEPLFFSSPNNSCSYFFTSNNAPFKTTNGLFFLLEDLWIFLAINSLPDPVGPLIKILLSVCESFEIWSLIVWIFWLSPINSNEWNNFVWSSLFWFFKLKFSTALLIKFINLVWSKGFWINSNAPDFNDLTAISILAWPEIIITGISLFFFFYMI